jgi:hypothetical protein
VKYHREPSLNNAHTLKTIKKDVQGWVLAGREEGEWRG